MSQPLILFFDTETTGLPDFRAPSTAEHQPHLVRFASVLVDQESRAEIQAHDFIVRPDGWTIPPEVSAIHGITHDSAMESPWSEADVTAQYLILRHRASEVVGHNVSFDLRIMRIALLRLGKTREEIEALEAGAHSCTMLRATDLMKLAPTEKMMAAGFKKPKPPKLAECVKHFFGEEHDLAHDAMADVRACMRVYFHLLDTEGTVA